MASHLIQDKQTIHATDKRYNNSHLKSNIGLNYNTSLSCLTLPHLKKFSVNSH